MTEASISVSVVIPIYNKRRYLLRALESVLAQTRGDFEVILVDDGSTDASLSSIRHVHDARIRCFRQPNAGVSAARNTGVQLARAPLVAFLDADDTWDPGFLEALLELRDRHPAAGLYASAYRIKMPDAPARRARIAGLPRWREQFVSLDYFRLATRGELPISASSVMIPRALLLDVGGFPVGETMGEDQHVWWRICVRRAFAFDRRCLATYQQDAGARTCPANLPDRELPFSERLRDEIPTLGLTWWQRLHAYRYMGAHLLHLARENARAGRDTVARSLMRDWRTWLLPVKWLARRMQVATAG